MDSKILIEQLRSLKLPGMAEAVGDMLLMPSHLRPSLEAAVSKMIETEIAARDESRTARLLKAAKLRIKALLEDVKCSTARNLTKEQLGAVADCGFIRRGENLLITGYIFRSIPVQHSGSAVSSQKCKNRLFLMSVRP